MPETANDIVELPGRRLRGEVRVPGDKSLTHRAVIFGSAAHGASRITVDSPGRDNFATIRIMQQLGVDITGRLSPVALSLASEEGVMGFEHCADEPCLLEIRAAGFEGLRPPERELDCGNSGTTARLMTGVLAGRPFSAVLTGDESLRRRPFRRVVDPLSQMGVRFDGDMLPLSVTGGSLRPLTYSSPQASAQVKSAIMLAGLQAPGTTTVREPSRSRDHTERMLRSMGCPVTAGRGQDSAWEVSVCGPSQLAPLNMRIPGDFSAAAFFLVAGSIYPGSRITLLGVGFNESRIGLFHVLKRMGADIRLSHLDASAGEEAADIEVRSALLCSTDITAEDVVLSIDEVPILAVACGLAAGTSRITGAGELRVKESDRLAMTAALLRSFSIPVEQTPDGLIIEGRPEIAAGAGTEMQGREALWRRSGDHRIAMAGAVLEGLVQGRFVLSDKRAVETSFPAFSELFQKLVN